MEGAPISLILDVVVVVLLGLTIVYAARLSLQLRRLRDSKSDLDKVVRDLVKNIDRADRAVSGLKEAAKESGQELQSAIDKAMALSDELQLITDSGDRLANRLEQLVDGARPIVNNQTFPAPTSNPAPKAAAPKSSGQNSQQAEYAQHLRKLEVGNDRTPAPATGGPGFSIRDPDAERGIDPVTVEDDANNQGLYSEAERDLFRAMKGKGRG